MKVFGSWSMQSLHGEALLDLNSGVIVKQVDLFNPSPRSDWFNLFFCLSFSVAVCCSGHYISRFILHPSIRPRRLQRKGEEGEEIADDEGAEKALEAVAEI